MSDLKSIKLTGAEWKRFYVDTSVWGDDTYWDDGFIEVDGKEFPDIAGDNVSDTAVVHVHNGYICDGLPGVPDDLIDAIAWWQERQSNLHFHIAVPKDKVEAVQAALEALGVELKAL